MPIFAFSCDRCGHIFETILKWDEPAQCPDEGCKSLEVTKLVSAPAGYLWNCDRGGSTAPKSSMGKGQGGS